MLVQKTPVRANLKLSYNIENYVFLYIQQLDLS